MVAVREGSEVWIVCVLGIDADMVECHYWATTSESKNAVFKPAYIGSRTGKTILTYKLRKNEEPSKPWTGTSPLNQVVATVTFRVDKTGQHRLSSASRTLLMGYVIPHLS